MENAKLIFQALDINGKVVYQQGFAKTYPSGVTPAGSVEFEVGNLFESNIAILKYCIADAANNIIWEHERIYGTPHFDQIWNLAKTSLKYTSEVCDRDNGEKLLTVTVENTGSHAALFVRADLPENELYTVYWLDNYRLIEPGKKRTFQAKLTAGTTPGKITLRGWNTL